MGVLPGTITIIKRQIGAQMERRRATRYAVSAPALYRWERADGTLQEAQGTTLDICDRGVYVLAKQLPPLGAHLRLDVHLPPVSETARSVQLQGEGTVLRTSGQGPMGSGFAAAVVFQTGSSDPGTVLGSRRIQ